MIYITGDTHGNFYRVIAFIERHHLTKEDKIIILGDVGFNYFEDIRDEFNKKIMNKVNIPILCIQGNHEKRADTIGSYHKTNSLNIGNPTLVEEECPNIHFLIDGLSYNIEDKTFFIMGGAYSVDKHYRLARNAKWWDDEQPREQDKNRTSDTLSKNNKFDYVLTHTCPFKYMPRECFLSGIDQSKVDNSAEHYLDELETKINYNRWLCGHYHTNKSIDKLTFIFEEWVSI